MIEQCADKGMELQPYIEEMVQAAWDLEEAKRKRDKGARYQAEKKIRQAAYKIIKVEPTVAHLYMKACHPDLESYIREAWISSMPKMDNSLASVFFSSLFTLPDLTNLPAYSFALQFTLRLRKPYLSRDDTNWHILDNPVRKEKVFGLPMVAPTGWKGALRAVMRHEKEHTTLREEQQDRQMMRLFGNVTDETREAAFRSGRLRFYPTFFTQTGLEVINPHSRESGAGKQPIHFECVPSGAEGVFTLLYVPFDLIGKPEDKARAELAHDLTDVAKGIGAMLTIYGFGAKTSSGFGVVSDKLVEPGQLVLKVADLHSEEHEQSQPAKTQRKRKKKLRRYWKAKNRLKDEFLTDDNKLIPEKQYQEYIESLGQEYAKSDRQRYAKAKKWWEREGKALAEQPEKKPELKSKPETAEVQWPERQFNSLEELVEKIEVLAEQLRPGGTQ